MWIGNVLRQRRITLGWSVAEAAANIGISRSHLYKLETNERVPTLEMLKYIGMAYEMPMWVFLYCSDDGVEVSKDIAKAYKEMRVSLNQIVKEFL